MAVVRSGFSPISDTANCVGWGKFLPISTLSAPPFRLRAIVPYPQSSQMVVSIPWDTVGRCHTVSSAQNTFLYGTWYLGYFFWIWCSASIPFSSKLYNTSVRGCVTFGVPLNTWELPIKVSIFSCEYWHSKALARIPKWHHSPGIKASCSTYFMCEEFACCQLSPKWFDVKLILDFCVSLHPHFMMHFREQKTPHYFLVSMIGQ